MQPQATTKLLRYMDDESALDEWATCSKMEQVRNKMPIKKKLDDNP